MNDAELKALKHRVTLITRPRPELLTYYVLTSLAAFCAAPLVMIPLYFRYHTLRYRFDESGIFVGYGILFRREMQLTWQRMQDIHLSQNILERWLGIGTVTVQTAGSSEASHLSIVGVRDFEAIRDYLYLRMRGGLHSEPKAEGEHALLAQIRDALVETARALSKGQA